MSGHLPSTGNPGGAGSRSESSAGTSDLILDRLAKQAQSRPTAAALYQKDDSGTFVPITWAGYQEQVRAVAAACIALGLPVGGAIGLVSESRAEWVISALGVMSAGGMAAGIYQTATAEQAVYILGHCEAMVAVVENASQWKKLAPALDRLPKLKRVVFMSGEVPADAQKLQSSAGGAIGQSWRDFLDSGTSFRADVSERLAALLPDQVASLIYTSGTTGTPKGVMLTHENLAWTASCGLKLHDTGPDDISVSYLPLSHIAEQMFSIYIPITSGGCIYFAGSIDKLRETLLVARPTIFFGVPRVWEKLQIALQQKLAAASPIQRRVIAWARDVGLRSGHYRLEHGAPYGLLAIEEKLATKLFFAKLKAAIGLDRLRIASSAAAAIRKEVLDFFLSLQVPIYEIYGQSESSGPITSNSSRPGQTRLGTVGRPLPGTSVKLAPDGEILFRGPNVFAGYYKDDEGTAAALQGGWLQTGDVGEFDADGFLRITDRKKDLFKTSGGKYVAPQPIEGALRAIPLVSQALIIGENRKYVSALLTLDPERVRAFATDLGLPTELEALAEHDKVRTQIQEHIDRINRSLERVETIKRFVVLPRDFSIENDEITATQKLRRRVILQRYAAAIESMYVDDGHSESGHG